MRNDTGTTHSELEEDENPELRDFRRRFWWTLPLTIVVTFLAMFGHQLNLFDMAVQSWIELVLSLPIVLGQVGHFFPVVGNRL
jgi:Cu+-exporting ATPase